MAKKKEVLQATTVPELNITLPDNVLSPTAFADNATVIEEIEFEAEMLFEKSDTVENQVHALATKLFDTLVAMPWGESLDGYTLVRKEKAELVGIPLLTKKVDMLGFSGEATLVKATRQR
jgi:hypothetical protein